MSSLKAVITAARLLAESTGLSLKSTIASLALKAEVVVGFFLRSLFLSDSFGVADDDTLDVGKNISESPTVADQDVITLLKKLTDSGALTDDDVLTIIKGLTETPAVAEAHIFALTKPLTDSGSVADLPSIRSVKPLTEAPSGSDNDTLAFVKAGGDDTIQNYCDLTYFSEDYIEGERTDLLFFTDDNVVSITKNLADGAFVTDDLDGEASTEDDQEIAFVKTRTNIASVAEVFSKIVAFIRSFTETPALTDEQTLSVSKDISETPTVTEDVGKVIQFPKSDAATVADSDVLSAGKNFADNGGIIDSEVVQFTKVSSDSGVAADSGSLRSQGYCDFTYFAEDYVGASRTFT